MTTPEDQRTVIEEALRVLRAMTDTIDNNGIESPFVSYDIKTGTAHHWHEEWRRDAESVCERLEDTLSILASLPQARAVGDEEVERAVEAYEKGLRLVVSDEPVTLAECPVGLFLNSYGNVCLKSEYGSNEGRIDAYTVDSGEVFWGTAPQTIASQRAQLVRPITLSPTNREGG